MLIDCDRCAVRGDACADCVVTVLLGPAPTLELSGTERRALDTLADAGMVPRLRLLDPRDPHPHGCDRNHTSALPADAAEAGTTARGERSTSDGQRSGRRAI